MADGGDDREASTASPARASGVMSVFHVFTDERCNAKLLALAVGGSLGDEWDWGKRVDPCRLA